MNFALVVVAAMPAALLAYVLLRPVSLGTLGRGAAVAGGLAAGWCVGVAAAWFTRSPWLLWMGAAGLAAAMLMSVGRVRGWLARGPLPPGTLAFSADVRALSQREFYLRSFERMGPVFKMAQLGTPTICVVGMDRIGRLVRGHASHLGPSPLAFSQSVMGNFLRYMDDETHARYGAAFRRAFAGPAAPGLEHLVRGIVTDGLDGLSRQQAASPFRPLQRMTRESLSSLFFGFDPRAPTGRAFNDVATRFVRAGLGHALRRADRDMLRAMRQMLLDQLERLRQSSTATAAGSPALLRIAAIDPLLIDETVLSNFVFLHKIATGNVSALLVWLAYYWSTQPMLVAEIRRRQAAARERALDLFLAETLRFCQSEYIYRTVRTEFEFEGYRFPRGWMVRSCTWESHRTTTALDSPTVFQLRDAPDAYARDHYVPFGMGRHVCNGVDVNHVVCSVFLRDLAERFDLEMRDAEPFQRAMRHWSHWRPHRSARVTVRRRA